MKPLHIFAAAAFLFAAATATALTLAFAQTGNASSAASQMAAGY